MFSSVSGPLNIVASKSIRDALTNIIVRPLICQASRVVNSFRVVWRYTNASDVNSSWLQILQRRAICDAIVRRHRGVDFFFSAVAGLYNKSCRRADAWAMGITPAISYFVVGEGILNGDLGTSLWKRIQTELEGAELKTISTRRPTNVAAADEAGNVAAPLFIVLKDYNSKYVSQQLGSCCPRDGSTAAGQSPIIAKLVVVNGSMSNVMRESYASLRMKAPSLYLELDDYN